MIRPHSVSAIFAIVIIALPTPPLQGRSLMVPTCLGGPSVKIDLPPDPLEQERHGCCRKGCHAANDRRKKANDLLPDCC
ncbi:MAG: hypothetical protein ABL928_02790 [Sphingorhabdus sp.]